MEPMGCKPGMNERSRFRQSDEEQTAIGLHVAVGDYRVYLKGDYQSLTADTCRTAPYRKALEAHARGKVVLDIGTGAHADWAIAAAEAGADRVYAMEAMDDAFRSARDLIGKHPLGDRISLIAGLSWEVTLPEPVDLCISEIIGNIGSSEAAPAVLNDARRRFLVPNGQMIPFRCDTSIAAIALPDSFRLRPAITRDFNVYCDAIFDLYDRQFDPRLALVFGDGQANNVIVSTEVRVERLDFHTLSPTRYETPFKLEITRSGHIDGFICWIQLWTMPGVAPIDSRSAENASWSMGFIPGVDLDAQTGDCIKGCWFGSTSDDGVNMDYRVTGHLHQLSGAQVAFEASGCHHPLTFQNSHVHRELFKTSVELPRFVGWPRV
jgi:protein arginine N-methyltransferase 1